MPQQLQQQIIETIKKQLGDANGSLATALAEILNLSKNAVYKRLEGSTLFSIQDIVLLSQHFYLPLESMLYPDASSVQAKFSGFEADDSSFEFLQLIEKELVQFIKAEKIQAYLVTDDLPDMYFYFFEELALFRVYTWERMAWRNESWQEKKFSFEYEGSRDVVSQTKRMMRYYEKIPALEIWNYQVFEGVYQQVLYLLEVGEFENPKDALVLSDKLGELLDHIYEMAVTGKRFLPDTSASEEAVTYELYHNEVMHNNNIILIEADEQKRAFPVLDNPHYIIVEDDKMYDYLKAKFEALLYHSTPLSKTSDKSRRLFFSKLKKSYEEFKVELEKIVGV